jgi:hypothetical protein
VHALPEGGDQMRYRTLITIGAVVAACGALGGAPALASQSSSHPALAAVHPSHAVVVPDTALNGTGCDVMNCWLLVAIGVYVSADGVHAVPFRTPVLGHVGQNGTCWPFSDCQFDTLSGYSGSEVLQFIDQDNVNIQVP